MDEAWKRLLRWRGEGRGAPADGDAALTALADIGTIRRWLDQAELAAVRVARRERRSWAEIATQLGVTRQSAWERWRDVDDEVPGRESAPSEAAPPASAIEAAAAERVAHERRRRGTVKVPNVVGLPWDDARAVLRDKGLVAVNADPDAPPPVSGEAGWVVTDQSPESGARVAADSRIRLWLRRGGGAGVREPRQPRPVRGAGRGMLPEPSDRAAG